MRRLRCLRLSSLPAPLPPPLPAIFTAPWLQTDRSGDALTAAQQREGAVQVAPEHVHPTDRPAQEAARQAAQGAAQAGQAQAERNE